jgi:N-methylhydantoinase A
VKRVAIVSDPSRAPFDLARWQERFAELEAALERDFEEERLPTRDLSLQRSIELQFRGQVHALRVSVEPVDLELDDGGEQVIDRFTERYEAKYGPGTAYRKAGVEAMTFVVEGVAGMPVPQAEPLADEGTDPAGALTGHRPVYLPESGGLETADVYSAEALRPGNELNAPAIVEAEDTTVLMPPGQRLWVDGFLNLRIEVNG